MKMSHWLVALGAMALIGAGALALADVAPPTTVPSVKVFKMSVPELVKSLPDLSQTQKGKIEDLHKEADAAAHKLHDQEKADVWAVLSDAQKQEVADAEDAIAKAHREASDERRIKRDEQKAAQDASTQPSTVKP